MNNKKQFVKEILDLITDNPPALTAEARDYFMKTFCPDPSTIKLTDAAKEILQVMQDRPELLWTSKGIGDILGKSGRSISGSMRKLVEIGYVEKASENPVSYKLTENGIDFKVD